MSNCFIYAWKFQGMASCCLAMISHGVVHNVRTWSLHPRSYGYLVSCLSFAGGAQISHVRLNSGPQKTAKLFNMFQKSSSQSAQLLDERNQQIGIVNTMLPTKFSGDHSKFAPGSPFYQNFGILPSFHDRVVGNFCCHICSYAGDWAKTLAAYYKFRYTSKIKKAQKAWMLQLK